MKRKMSQMNTSMKYLLCIVFASLAMSIGYATINTTTLNIVGTAATAENGEVKIVSLERVGIKNITETSAAQINADGNGVIFNLSVTVDRSNADEDFYVKYKIKIKNDSLFEHAIQATNFNPKINGSGSKPTAAYVITDLNGNQALNDTIPAKEEREYYVTINLYPTERGTWTVEGETEVETGENDDGIINGSLPSNSTGDLTGDNVRTSFTATVMNTHQNAKDFIFTINNPNFKIVDENGNDLSEMTIAGQTTDTFDFYIERNDGARFPSSPQMLNVNITSGENTSSMGAVSLNVDVDTSLIDNDAPIIENVKAEIVPNSDGTYTNYMLHVSWNGSDDVGVKYYTVETYRATSLTNTGTKIATNNTMADETSIDINVSQDGYYYFKVYGYDNITPSNTATSAEISSCSTESGHCSRSETKNFKWNFTVVISLSNASISGKTPSNGKVTYNVNYDGEIEASISGTGNYEAPRSISNPTITYSDGTSEQLSSNANKAGYSYNLGNSSGTLKVWHITGDVTMSASGYSGCFAKGTKILLANGKTKNIEDIDYTDLLAVWNYDTGKLTYEYPLWIEKKQEINVYKRITFSDNTYLDVIAGHSFYNTDINLFVSHLDKENFHVGSHIAKIDNNGKFMVVSVKSIENVNKYVEYYYVGSTTYYNVIANNILSTYQDPMISNLYGFQDNATWPKEKEMIVNNSFNIVPYDKFKDVLPYYMYKGFRAGEVGYLINNNIITLEQFKGWIKEYVMCEDTLMYPINKNNHNYWMVTTSQDDVNDINERLFLREEGSIYILPSYNKYVLGKLNGILLNNKNNNSKFKGWFNTADNKIYYPGDSIKVNHGLHFIAIYE